MWLWLCYMVCLDCYVLVIVLAIVFSLSNMCMHPCYVDGMTKAGRIADSVHDKQL